MRLVSCRRANCDICARVNWSGCSTTTSRRSGNRPHAAVGHLGNICRIPHGLDLGHVLTLDVAVVGETLQCRPCLVGRQIRFARELRRRQMRTADGVDGVVDGVEFEFRGGVRVVVSVGWLLVVTTEWRGPTLKRVSSGPSLTRV